MAVKTSPASRLEAKVARLLVARARVEGLMLLTADRQLAAYDVALLRVE